MDKNIIFREANVSDIPGMQVVRNAVKENVLSDPKIITDLSYVDYLTDKGKGWVAVIDLRIIGFSFVDLKNHSIWALFVHPEFESMGIGKTLQKLMLDWYFSKCQDTVWLGTASKTRAEQFYLQSGWIPNGYVNKGEVKFEMTYLNWKEKLK